MSHLQRYGSRLDASEDEDVVDDDEKDLGAVENLKTGHKSSLTASRAMVAAPQPIIPAAAIGMKQTPWARPSLDSRASSTTPDIFMMSPSVMALQQKYGSSSDGSGVMFPLSTSVEPPPSIMDADMDVDMDEGGHPGQMPFWR